MGTLKKNKPADIIQKLEDEFNVNSVTVDNVPVWNFLKHVLCNALENRYYDLEKYPPKRNWLNSIYNYFWTSSDIKNKHIMLFTDLKELRNIDGLKSEKLAHNIIKKYHESLLVVLNPIYKKHGEKYFFNAISSHYFSFTFPTKKTINNENILLEIEKKIGLKLDYHSIINRFFSIYKKAKKYFKKNQINTIYINCYYSTYHQAIILAAKEHDIKIIEIQHGVISSNQCYYNPSMKSDGMFLPDYLLSFGDYVANHTNHHYMLSSKIIPFGNYYLEHAKNNTASDGMIHKMKKKYEKIILISEQASVRGKTSDIIVKLAKLYPNFGFIFALRDGTDKSNKTNDNIFTVNVDVYRIAPFVDLHLSVYSTFILESLFLGVPNMLFNINSLSEDYLGGVLNDSNNLHYVDDLMQMKKIIDEWPFDQKDIIKQKYQYLFNGNNDEPINQYVNQQP